MNRSEEHTSELQSHSDLVCRLLLEKKKSHMESYDYLKSLCCLYFFFNDTATTEIYTLSLHDALPIWCGECPSLRSKIRQFIRQFIFVSLIAFIHRPAEHSRL